MLYTYYGRYGKMLKDLEECLWKSIADAQHRQDPKLMPICYKCDGTEYFYGYACGYYAERYRNVPKDMPSRMVR